MTRLSLLSLFFMAVCASIGCKKSSTNITTPADSPSIITFTTPLAGVIALNGTNLSITGTISDNDVLATATVQIRNKATGAVLFQQSSTTGNVAYYNFSWNWTVTGISSATPATVRVTSIDKLGYSVYNEVDIVLDN